MAFKKWIVNTPNKELAKNLAEECDIDPFTAMLAVSRGINDASDLELFLSDELMLCDPRELIDIEKAADAVNSAIAEDILIAVFGDYDCDGITATAIVYKYLISRGARVVAYIPERMSEGYGMTRLAVEKLNGMGVGMIITVDNGISCHEEIDYANQLGIKTVVTDHHLPPEVLPEALAVVDPHRKDCPSTFKEICGAQVAFKLICVIEDKAPEQMLYEYADLLAIATIGDIMPIINENRSIVREGLRRIKNTSNSGISALISVAGIKRDKITSGNLSFGLVPRINAAGRMGSAERAFRLLTCNDGMAAISIANELDAENAKRQETEKKILSEVCQIIERDKLQYDRIIVVAGDGWHKGVVGIVASRLVKKYGKPSIVLTCHDGIAEGSGRSVSGFSLYNALSECKEALLKFGGHELAAGMGLKQENISEFRRMINDYAFTKDYSIPTLNIDLRLNPAGLSVDMADAISSLEPFGFGNPAPIFGIFGVTLDKINPIGEGKHLKLMFSKNGAIFQSLLFGVRPEQFCFEIGDVLDLAVTLSVNEYNGIYSLSVQIDSIKMSGTDDDALFSQFSAYHDFLSGRRVEHNILTPTREEIGVVYKKILAHSISAERLKYIFLNSLGFAKTQISQMVLLELGLIRLENGILSAVPNAAKTNLEVSKLYQKLLREG